MKKLTTVIIALAMAILMSATAFAEEEKAPLVEVIESEPEGKAQQYVTIDVSVADNVELPMTLKLESGAGVITMDISQNGDSFMVIPTTYTVASAKSKSGKEYATGALLKVSENGGHVYLDFARPETESSGLPTWAKVLIANAAFFGIAFLAFRIFCWYREHLI